MIPHEELVTGIRLCRRNVKILLRDAHALYKRRSYGHAASLGIIAMEEYAKQMILAAKYNYPDRFESEVRDAFVDHDLKIQVALHWLREVSVGQFPTVLTDEKIEELQLWMAGKLKTARASCIYVDYQKPHGWYDPNDPSFREFARNQIHYVEEVTRKTDRWLSRLLTGKHNATRS